MSGREFRKRLSPFAATLFAMALLVPLPRIQAQGQPDKATTGEKRSPAEEFKGKTVTISGKVGSDGKSFVADQDEKNWTILNPRELASHAGQHVTITAVENSPRGELLVKTVRKSSAAPQK